MVTVSVFKSSLSTAAGLLTTCNIASDNVEVAGVVALDTQSFGYIFDGTTWDRIRSANVISGTTGDGLVGSGLMVFDSTNWQRAGTSGGISGTPGAGLLGVGPMLFDGTNYVPWRAGLGDNNSNTGFGWIGLQIFDGTNYDRLYSANGAANTTGTGLLGSGLMCFDGTNWQRVITATVANASLGVGLLGAGLLLHDANNYQRWNTINAETDGISGGHAGQVAIWLYNGTTFDRLRSASSLAGTIGTGLLGVNVLAFDGTNYNRCVSNAAGNIDDTTQPFQLAVAEPGEWTVDSSVAAAGTPSAVKAAGAAGVRHVCRNLSISLANVAVTPSALITFVLRDGASGAGTVKRTWQFVVPPSNTVHIDIAGLNIFGGTATAMTIESAAALPADVSGVASIAGYSTI